MQALKNMEIIFTVAVALACSVAYVSLARTPDPATADAPAMQVVVTSAKRMTEQEKAQSLAQERQEHQQALLGASGSKF
ncbi:hypothetical protein AAKU55_003572 [Oxalobacteraceae bacterium GrIS 1.11]